MSIQQFPRDTASRTVSPVSPPLDLERAAFAPVSEPAQPGAPDAAGPAHLSLVNGGEKLAPCVALIGCDGSGKSTLARDLVTMLDRRAPTRSAYLGLGTGDMGRRIGQWPIIGPLAERFLTGKARAAHDNPEKRLPGLPTALAMFGFSLLRRHRFSRALAMRARGVRLVTDRYPQAEVAGSFDGPGLHWRRRGSAMVEYLARRERALYEGMAAYRPDVVIRLNVDVDTALARKADHERAILERKIAVVPTLRFAGAPIVDVDATRPYEEVLASVLAVLRRYGIEA